MKEINIILNNLKDENWQYFMCDGTPYKTIFMQDRDILINYINRLETNWKELKKWLEANIEYAHWLENSKHYKNVLDKMQELESGNNE